MLYITSIVRVDQKEQQLAVEGYYRTQWLARCGTIRGLGVVDIIVPYRWQWREGEMLL